MSSVSHSRRPSVNSPVGSALPPKPVRPFGLGLIAAPEPESIHWGAFGLPTPVLTAPPVYEATARERDYEVACQAVTGGRAEWLASRPSVPDQYFDEPPTLPESLWHEFEADDAPVGDVYWSEELGHLESLRAHATPARRVEIDRRIDGVLAMLGLPAPVRAERPRSFEPSSEERAWWTLETERLQAESMERQMAASWAMSEIKAGAERWDGRGWEEQEACRGGNR